MDPNDLPARLRGGERFLLDGGVGSELIRLGLEDKPGVVHGPGVTRQVHENYLGAGVDLLTTDSFTTNRYVLRRFKHQRSAWPTTRARRSRLRARHVRD